MGGGFLERTLTDFFAQSAFLACGLILLGVFIQTANPVGILIPGNMLVFLSAVLAKLAIPGQWIFLAFGMIFAAFFGNLTGYFSGIYFGERAFKKPRLAKAKPKLETFFERHGHKAISLAFFIPFVRSGMPLLAGAMRVPRREFVLFSALGSIAWIAAFVVAGGVFGEIPFVRQNLDIAVIGVAVVVFAQIVFANLKAKKSATQPKAP